MQRSEALAGAAGLMLSGEREAVERTGEGAWRLREDLASLGGRLQAAIERYVGGRKGVVDVRRVGAMVGIEVGPFEWDQFVGVKVCERAREHGVILRPLGDVIVWMPPLNVSEEEVELLGKATGAAIEEVCST